MNAREWKPGDVAILSFVNGSNAVGVRSHKNDGWAHSHHFGSGSAFDDIGGFVVRPLVVIDPEDREQVERLTKAIVEAAFKHGNLVVSDQGIHDDTTQAALRSLVADPKPDEPQGLGAVVEDDRGVVWVRTERAKGIRNPWQATLNAAEPDDIRQLAYAEIAAVRVLSEGWSE